MSWRSAFRVGRGATRFSTSVMTYGRFRCTLTTLNEGIVCYRTAAWPTFVFNRVLVTPHCVQGFVLKPTFGPGNVCGMLPGAP